MPYWNEERWTQNEDGSYSRRTEPAEAVDLSSLSKAELVALAAEAGLETVGTKATLIERLQAE
jgi:hypothetical protein